MIGDRKEILEHALRNSVSDKDKCTASISVAQTLMDLLAYDDALEWFEKVLELEKKIGRSNTKLCQTQVLIFEAKCRRKYAKKMSLLKDFDELNSQIPDEHRSLKASIYRAMGQFFTSQGDREEALVYLGRAKELDSESDANVSEEEDEENEETSDDLDSRPDKAILRECMGTEEICAAITLLCRFVLFLELARLQNSDLEIENDRDKEKNAHGETRLHIAARSRDTAMVEKLIAAGYDVNRRDYGGWTPISEAVSAGMRDNVRALLKAGAKVDPVSTEVLNDEENSTGGGITPLMEACDKGLVEIARDLLKCGASVTKRNADGWTAVDFLRNLIVSCDEEDDEKYVKELTALAEFMEDMQRKQSFPVRGCAPQRRKSARMKPPLKISRPVPSVEEDNVDLSSYKRVIGRLGAQSSKTSKVAPLQNEAALFYEDDVLMRNSPPLEDDITRFAPLPIDDDFIVDDEKERRKRKNRDSPKERVDNVKKRSKLKRSQREPIRSREASPVSLSPDSNVPRLNSSSSTTQGLIIATLKFEDDSGNMLRPDKVVAFQRTSTMADAQERFRSELPVPRQTERFDLRLADGREADAEIPLISLGEPLVIVCRLHKPTAETLYKSRGGVAREDVVECLTNFDATSELDLSSSAPDRSLAELVLKVAADTKREIARLCLDGCGLHGLRMLDASFNGWLKGNHVENILSSCENLTELLLDGCDLRGLSFEPTWLPNLRKLSMVGCHLTEYGSLVEWMSMGCVQTLDLSGTDVTLDHVRTLVEARLMCPPIVVRLTRARTVERDPQAFVDMILAFVGDRTFPIRFQFSAHFVKAVRLMTAFASNFLCS
ncbi:tetratricopeptide repeat protein [Necator americanus]|uniref:Tetratricopeptide repeat protein n=1 Tax=Necator americanus TaxID=51031 RepID=W2T9Q7_NECAM|nr:tetratricopeptide repeat protein [Necator americanus]ETN78309.1 tetratricopeptide repeat protein [Necator americanus]